MSNNKRNAKSSSKSPTSGGRPTANAQAGNKSKSRGKRGSGSARPDDRTRDRTNYGDELNKTASGTLNDPSWYTRNPSLTVASASLPFPYRPGMDLPVWAGPASGATIAGVTTSPKVPGIATLHWAPSIGRATAVTDPINVAAKELFAQVRATFSGSIEADAPDFVIYLMSLDSIFAYIAGLKRIYSIISQYSPNNYLVPDALLKAFGFDDNQIEQLKINKMAFFGQIQQLIGMVSKFVCPAVFPLFARHYWLNQNVYADSDSANSQWYVFNMDMCYQFDTFDIGGSVQAGGLLPVAAFSNYATSGADINDYLFQRGLSLIQALAGSDDAYIISGYLQRAFQGAPSFGVTPLEMDMQFSVVYEPAVLLQIENSFCETFVDVNASGNLNTMQALLTVKQDPSSNTVLCPLVTSAVTNLIPYKAKLNPMLNVRSDTPGAIDVVEASRLVTMRDETNTYFICGSEFILGWSFADATGIDADVNQVIIYKRDSTESDDVTVMYEALGMVTRMGAYDWHPRVHLFNVGAAISTTAATVQTSWDYHNVTVFSTTQLEDINRICLYSLFNSFTM